MPPAGIEPATRGLGNRCSSPLSYEGGAAKTWKKTLLTCSIQHSSLASKGARTPDGRGIGPRVSLRAAFGLLVGGGWGLRGREGGIEADLLACDCQRGMGCTHTRTFFSSGSPQTPHQDDYLFASEALAGLLKDCWAPSVGPASCSDHAPIVATFEVPE